MDIDLEIIFELITNNLEDLRGILKSYLKRIKKNKYILGGGN